MKMLKTSVSTLALLLSIGAAQAQSQVGGYDSGPVSATALPNTLSHAAGSSIGGLFVIPLARTAGGSGIMTAIGWKSNGGSTGQIVIRGWSKKPSASTFACGDQAAYQGADSDDAFLIAGFPISLTPAAPAVTTGDSATYASLTVQTFDFKNNDNPPTQNLYFCAQTVATDTADENALVRLTVQGFQN
jgi:hypothetical protein